MRVHRTYPPYKHYAYNLVSRALLPILISAVTIAYITGLGVTAVATDTEASYRNRLAAAASIYRMNQEYISKRYRYKTASRKRGIDTNQ